MVPCSYKPSERSEDWLQSSVRNWNCLILERLCCLPLVELRARREESEKLGSKPEKACECHPDRHPLSKLTDHAYLLALSLHGESILPKPREKRMQKCYQQKVGVLGAIHLSRTKV